MSANVIIQFRRGTASEWTSANPTLASGEVGLETDTSKIKIGDGSTTWTSLSYLTVNAPGDLEALSDVTISSVDTGEFLKWNGSAWVNDAINLGTDTVGDYIQSLVAGTGVSLTNNSGEGSTPTVSIGQSVGTTDNVTFNDVTVSGDLTVNGTTTTVNTETINLADNVILINSNATGSATEDGGIEVERGDDDNVTLIWDETNNRWTVGAETFVAGTFIGDVTGDVTGNADTATSLETARTIQLSGDVAGSASFDGSGDINISATVQADSVALGTDTTGNYTEGVTGGTGVTVTGGTGEGNTPSIAIGQAVGTTDNVTFNTVNADLTGNVTGTVSDVSNHDLTDLGDVDMTTLAPSEGDVVYYDGTNWVPYPLSLSSASDVSIAGAATGEVLSFDGTNWVPTVISTDPIRIPLSGASDGFVTGATVHTTPAGYTDTLYLYGSGTGNVLVTSSGTDTFNPNASSVVYSLALQSDGKIVIGGGFTTVGGVSRNRVARVHANGDLDTTFNPNVANSDVRSLALQSDGKVLIGGTFTTVGGLTRNRIARIHANGDLDTTFDPNASGWILSVAVQSDDKILLAGEFTSIGGVTRNYIARVHANGDLDTTFNPNANGPVWSIAVQSDGKILIGGSYSAVGGVTRNKIARVHANGDLDTTFNPNASSTVASVTEQSDGKIVIGGSFSSVGGVTRDSIARVHANGDLDTTFDPNVNNDVNSITEQSDGRILIGGAFITVGGVTRNRVARLYANGDLDTTFDPNASGTVYSLAIQSDDKIVIGGFFTSVGGVTRNRVARVDGLVGGFNDITSKVYVSPGANSMDLIVSDYPLPAGYSMLSQVSGTMTGYVTREAN